MNTSPLFDGVNAARPPLRETAYSALRRAILEGHFRDGQRLIEADLAAMMQVSRTPIREAIHKLELQGFVRRSPPRGVIVSRVSRREIEEVFEVRRLIEPYAVGLAVVALTADDIVALQVACREAIAYAAGPMATAERIGELNARFYDLLYRRCPNERLSALVFDLRDRFMFLDSMIAAFTLMDLDERRQGTKLIQPILDQTQRRDRMAVEELILGRLDRLRDAVLARVPEGNDDVRPSSGRASASAKDAGRRRRK